MKQLSKYNHAVALILCLAASSLSCITIEKIPTGGQAQTSATGLTRPHPPVRTGTITTGTRVDLGTQTISTAGGTITISKPSDPLNGMQINVPQGSYQDTKSFKISSAPVTNQTFGSDFNPVSPLITVDNGAGYANQLITIKVPVQIPQGHFAMGFIYDEKTKKLEGMGLVEIGIGYVTVATRHFSSFVIGSVISQVLQKDIDCGFRPGIDDWQFTNYGSFIAPGGHCWGQSMTAMWYYIEHPDGADAALYNRYDNNGRAPASPTIWQDDSFGYRFASTVQQDDNTSQILLASGTAISKYPELAYKAFVYAIQMTGEPQYVRLRKTGTNLGHAMIVYRASTNTLSIADPNYPGVENRKIEFKDGKLGPYESGANRAEIEAGNSTRYDLIDYLAKTAFLDWAQIGKRWTEFKNGTIGNDRFPAYQVLIGQDNNVLVPMDGYKTDNKIFWVRVKNTSTNVLYDSDVYRDGALLQARELKYELKPGNNHLGIYVHSTDGKYIDFKWVDAEYQDGECKPPPADMLAKMQKTTVFRCELLNLPTTIEGKGSMQKWVPGFKFTKHFYVPGNAIKVGGEGTMAIKWAGSSFSGGGTGGYPDKLTGSVCYENGKLMVSFDYASNDPVDNLRLSVRKLPCDPDRLMKPAAGGRPELLYMSTQAPVVKGFVTTLEWKSHEERPEFNGPPLVWDASLTAKDWSAQCGFDVVIH